jgi:sec-independent protein translocase protein TatA
MSRSTATPGPRGTLLAHPLEGFSVPFNIGPLELVIVLVIVLVIFGPKRLPGLGRSLGTGMREFKDSITGNSKDEDEDEEKPEQLAAAADEPEKPAQPADDKPARVEGDVVPDRHA